MDIGVNISEYLIALCGAVLHCIVCIIRAAVFYTSLHRYRIIIIKMLVLHHWFFVKVIHQAPVDSHPKGPVMQKAFPCHAVAMLYFRNRNPTRYHERYHGPDSTTD